MRSDSESSMTTPGCARRKSARIGGSTSAPMISLAAMRTTPCACTGLPGDGAQQRGRGARHGFGMRLERKGRVGGRQPVLRAREQRGLQRGFELADVTADGRLGQAQAARGAGQAALAQHGEE